MKRREFITLLGGAAAWPLAAVAQQPKVWRIGVLAPVPPMPAMLSTFRDGMRERGYVEGQNLSVDFRWPQGTFEQNPSVAAELIRSNVDVLVAWASPAVIAARRATSTIPIVMTNVGDPLGSGFVASLARPGGNVTGVSNISRDLTGKLIQHLVEIVPGMNRVGVVHNASNPAVTVELRETEDAIRAHTRRREFIAGLGGAVAWPLVARAQQQAVPVVGFLSARSADDSKNFAVAFLQGLKETGYVEGQNDRLWLRW